METTAPRTQKHLAGPEMLEHLKSTKMEQEDLLSQTGITDPSEGDFSNCVQPILATCSKESIAVSIADKHVIYFDNNMLSVVLAVTRKRVTLVVNTEI